ncbi:G patch domain and ankyrin repeat-containing protein 1 homolog [Copidosoma floridanum]|uniref:G patch domain and ankyrin repeat-containing protein 1 homolog n=1 Tax=Copidosoma floridanum TaxID=29053 RepID=UPI000C6FB835|nr:G patch domain and ankyrin repeat-containing protein 1 homolog [Copidosoma floridanum]
MRRAVNNLALSLSEIPIKTFIKETNAEPSLEEKKHKCSLSFEGDQAKRFYEEVIVLESQQESLPRNNNAENKKVKNVKQRSPNRVDKIGVHQLFKAVELGDKEFVFKYFNRENVNITDQFGWTPLMSAAYSGLAGIVSFLLDLGASVKARDKSGYTAIDLAGKKNNTEIISLIKQKSRKYKRNVTKDSLVHNGDKESKKEIKNTKFYCDVCKMECTDSSLLNHESSIVHLFNTNPKIRDTYYGIPKCNRGYQMLLNRGWDEEGGLGPSGEGQQYPVKTVLKRDRKGLGQSEKKDQEILDYFQKIEAKGLEILTDRQEVVALDKRRNDDRMGMRALQKQNHDKTWMTVGPILLKMPAKKAEELLKEDQKQCDIEINKIRSDLKVKVNELRDIEHNPPVPGLMLKPMSKTEMAAMNQVMGKSP